MEFLVNHESESGAFVHIQSRGFHIEFTLALVNNARGSILHSHVLGMNGTFSITEPSPQHKYLRYSIGLDGTLMEFYYGFSVTALLP